MMDVTPLVDVVFLLLIFFMVTTTFSLDKGIQLDLPSAETARKSPPDKKEAVIKVVVDAEGLYYIQGSKVPATQLTAELLKVSQDQKDIIIHVQADKNSSHGSVVRLMDTARKLQLNRFSLITVDGGEVDEDKQP
jgi:biopolymer transport protein ExbD